MINNIYILKSIKKWHTVCCSKSILTTRLLFSLTFTKTETHQDPTPLPSNKQQCNDSLKYYISEALCQYGVDSDLHTNSNLARTIFNWHCRYTSEITNELQTIFLKGPPVTWNCTSSISGHLRTVSSCTNSTWTLYFGVPSGQNKQTYRIQLVKHKKKKISKKLIRKWVRKVDVKAYVSTFFFSAPWNISTSTVWSVQQMETVSFVTTVTVLKGNPTLKHVQCV